MNKKLQELLNQINAKKAEVKNLVDENKIAEAKAAKEELKNLQEQFDLLKDVEDPDGDGTVTAPINSVVVEKPPVEGKNNAVAEFAAAARRGFKNVAATPMSEGTPSDGGYTVPEDIQTRINEYRDAKMSLIQLVDVEHVSTNKGARTFKKRAQQTGFSKVGENTAIGAKNTPQFERIEYSIDKYAGYFPVTNELLADSDANIVGVLTRWIGDESRVTRNKLILEQMQTKAVTAITSLDDIKKALNVTLGQAFKPTSKIITNDDGLQWLDTLKDSDGKYLLQPNPANPMQLRLCAGATIIPVVVVPNADLPSDTATAKTRKIPIFIGDLKEAIKFFDRNQMSIMTSNVAAIGEINAFENDLTIFRAIEREDCIVKDSAAYVYGQYSMSDDSVAGE